MFAGCWRKKTRAGIVWKFHKELFPHFLPVTSRETHCTAQPRQQHNPNTALYTWCSCWWVTSPHSLQNTNFVAFRINDNHTAVDCARMTVAAFPEILVKSHRTGFDKNYGFCASHHSTETPANRFYFEKKNKLQWTRSYWLNDMTIGTHVGGGQAKFSASANAGKLTGVQGLLWISYTSQKARLESRENILVVLCVLPTGRCSVGLFLVGCGCHSDKTSPNTSFHSLRWERDCNVMCPCVHLHWTRPGSKRTCLFKWLVVLEFLFIHVFIEMTTKHSVCHFIWVMSKYTLVMSLRYQVQNLSKSTQWPWI